MCDSRLPEVLKLVVFPTSREGMKERKKQARVMLKSVFPGETSFFPLDVSFLFVCQFCHSV